MRSALLLLALLGACDGFTEVNDGGVDASPLDRSLADGQAGDLGADGPAGPDLGGKRPAGECCSKAEDCVSNLCTQLGQGPAYCNTACSAAPDDCPVGFRCDGTPPRCVPPPIGGYSCGPHVVTAGIQPLGGCCGKLDDCQSGHCINVGTGAYFCSESCTSQPQDSCPTGYVCSTADLCATPTTSSCTYR